jgi:hypothetical protein
VSYARIDTLKIRYFENAARILDDVIRSNAEFRANPDAALKAAGLDTELSRRLHTPKDAAKL